MTFPMDLNETSLEVLLEKALDAVGAASTPDSDDLHLDSLQVVLLVDLLESEWGLCFDGTEVTRSNFSSRNQLRRLLEEKRRP